MTVSKLITSILIFLLVSGCASTPESFDDTDEATASSDEDLMSDLDDEEESVDPELVEDELEVENTGRSSAALEVTDLRYSSADNGGTVVIRTSGRATYRLREVPEQKQVVLEVANASLPERLKRPYITREFNQSISAINAYQDSGSTTARFVVQLRGAGRLRVEQKGNEIFLAPEENSSTGSIALGTDDGGSGSGGGVGVAKDSPFSGNQLDDLNYASMRFYGKPISIEVRDTRVAEVINFISEQSGANLVVSDEVKGEISLKLKQVPWDQALMLVMKSRQLGYVRQGNVLRIAPLETLHAETENAKRVIDAQRNAEPLRVRVVPVSYADVGKLAGQVKEFLGQRGKATPDPRTSSIIITDIVENIERATNLIKALDIPPLQVQIEAKVIEAREGFSRQIGVKWGASGASTDVGGLELNPKIAVNPDVADTGNNGDFSFSLGQLDFLGDLNAQLALSEIKDQVKVISAPRIVMINNETANIAQTTEVPSATTTTNGNVTTTGTETTDVKLSLDVTPQITSGSDVIMMVTIRRDFAGAPPPGVSKPIINRREAKTRVMVQSGQTAVIGGIYQNDTSNGEAGVPGLSNIPILGWLFRSRSTEWTKNELLLFLTPRILNADEGIVKSEEL